ncbi:TniB family NTP-binding protein [Hymenobacter wooponensis]|uniref:AAA family ATPase n=1 Tax=Hymenobacter wooponensis TaxID=1525360 RepID=A0A4Z0MFT8_9BACT|nr:TniB family NTP-binding protein [Hymenobacter wooponensis]TGD78237.1 AAA family ATPase [Hymenobacter wooponensis]
MEHLNSSTADWLDKPDAERIRAILVDKWVVYTLAQHVLDYLAFLQAHPAVDRMPNLLLYGDTGNGKTRLLQYYANANKPQFQPRKQPSLQPQAWPVLYLQAPAVPDERRLYHAILVALHAPYAEQGRVDAKQHLVKRLLSDLQVRVLILDEVQHVLACTQTKQREVLNMLKALSNDVRIPLVLAGIRTAQNVIMHDEQMHDRCDRLELPRWKMDDEYLRLLSSLERLFPLRKPSNLIDLPLAAKLLALSQGTIGGLVKWLKRLAVHAVVTGQECISLAQVKQIEKMPLGGWLPPAASTLVG